MAQQPCKIAADRAVVQVDTGPHEYHYLFSFILFLRTGHQAFKFVKQAILKDGDVLVIGTGPS